jgi:phosphatidylglycerophosphatase A
MTNETDRPPVDKETLSASARASGIPASSVRKPRLAIFMATAAGLGYMPKAPGTFGSFAGLIVALLPWWTLQGAFSAALWAQRGNGSFYFLISGRHWDPILWTQIILTILVAAIGVWSANRAAEYWRQKDPPRVVIDEVSGQHLALLLGCGIPLWWRAVSDAPWTGFPIGLVTFRSELNWKYLLLGFILFRVFDIWKPFPARQAESLPGGWGIMADDWVAGIYAGLGLWIARALGL